ncbi:NADH dehydrogenase (ubiquinone) MLRQ subunit [Arctopsyche grandis]|uniref:NADH dehydrogenase (ubiquinone) MLRQ subunit n=1 Tax=Arctopsyche grandis TaxID=121162 RepID=UPI00406DA437
MKGFSVSGMKQHPSLIPLFAFVGFGCAVAGLYTLRLASRSPDVSWNRQTNPEPFQEYKQKQYKLYNAGNDDVTVKSEAPKF